MVSVPHPMSVGGGGAVHKKCSTYSGLPLNLKCTSQVCTCSIPILSHFVLEIWLIRKCGRGAQIDWGALLVHQGNPGTYTKGVSLGCSEVE